MKLLAKIRDQIQKEQQKISNEFAVLLGFKSIHDTNTVIPRCNGKKAVEWLKKNRATIEDNFPREATKKLRQLDQEYPDADVWICCIHIRTFFKSKSELINNRILCLLGNEK